MEGPKSHQILTQRVATTPVRASYALSMMKYAQALDGPEATVFAASPGSTPSYRLTNGLFEAVVSAYNNHHHLHLTPDDVWLAIAQGLSQHLDYQDNAEKYRKRFVTHEGKVQIVYRAGAGTVHGVDWNDCVAYLTGEVGKRVVVAVDKIMQADFSTTTQVSLTASRIVLLDAMKHYFEYVVQMLCGIPEVTLHGSLEDWERVREKARALRALDVGLDWWLDALDPVLQHFIDTYQGKVDEQFWGLVVNESKFHGSGGGEPAKVSGWITRFFPYDKDKRVRRNLAEPMTHKTVPDGRVACPFILDDNGHQTKCQMVAGFFGTQAYPDGGIGPQIGWAIRTDPTPPPTPKWARPYANARRGGRY